MPTHVTAVGSDLPPALVSNLVKLVDPIPPGAARPRPCVKIQASCLFLIGSHLRARIPCIHDVDIKNLPSSINGSSWSVLIYIDASTIASSRLWRTTPPKLARITALCRFLAVKAALLFWICQHGYHSVPGMAEHVKKIFASDASISPRPSDRPSDIPRFVQQVGTACFLFDVWAEHEHDNDVTDQALAAGQQWRVVVEALAH